MHLAAGKIPQEACCGDRWESLDGVDALLSSWQQCAFPILFINSIGFHYKNEDAFPWDKTFGLTTRQK
jgi:hypothetical protein